MRALLTKWSESILDIPQLVRLHYGGVTSAVLDNDQNEDDDVSSFGAANNNDDNREEDDDLDNDDEIQSATLRGERPYLHPDFRTRSLIERRLTEIMDLCHVLEPKDRVDIFTVVQHLRETQRLHEDER